MLISLIIIVTLAIDLKFSETVFPFLLSLQNSSGMCKVDIIESLPHLSDVEMEMEA